MKVYISFCTTSEPCARGAREELGVLEHRRLDRPVAVERAEPLHLADDALPERLLGREDVVRAARPLRASRAQLGEERVAGELVAERRRRAVARSRRPSRAGRRRPATGSTPPASPSRRTAGRCGRPSRRRARRPRTGSRRRSRRGDRASDPGTWQPGTRSRPPRRSRRRRAASPRPRTAGSRCREEVVRASEDVELALRQPHRRTGAVREIGERADVVVVAVREQDRRARGARSGER